MARVTNCPGNGAFWFRSRVRYGIHLNSVLIAICVSIVALVITHSRRGVRMLQAVPAQVPSVPAQAPREAAFVRVVEDALQLPEPDALSVIVRQYSGDTRALQARADDLSAEASEAAEEKRRHWTMLMQVQSAASQKIWETAHLSAELATYREMFGQVRRLADRAGGEPLAWEDVSAALSIEPLEPAFMPVTLAFVPSGQYRGGQFSAEAQDVVFVFTFIGWALVDHGPGAYGCVEPMFLVDDRPMPRSVIEHERHVRLDSYLPHLQRAA